MVVPVRIEDSQFQHKDSCSARGDQKNNEFAGSRTDPRRFHPLCDVRR
ncbi:hypothetical protein BM43_4146 [Burkholderia gladioli]|uniref:Uncharacterized protein n=1 Tax=Burkholderia gladioli TaxID=28095 RepID=A0AAW3ETK6_BURGA|nr:hypothetical protein BM43_4146 [Burkholderia gladioli]KGC11035.1 hypothetical protein DM48_7349 [Burkholderia gladioli]